MKKLIVLVLLLLSSYGYSQSSVPTPYLRIDSLKSSRTSVMIPLKSKYALLEVTFETNLATGDSTRFYNVLDSVAKFHKKDTIALSVVNSSSGATYNSLVTNLVSPVTIQIYNTMVENLYIKNVDVPLGHTLYIRIRGITYLP